MENNESYNVIRIYLVIVLVVMAFVVFSLFRCCGKKGGGGDADTVKVERVEKHDTIYIEKHDTLPIEVERKVVQYVKIPVPVISDSIANDTIDVTMPVVQKRFSDDSTYTAYVSGVEYQDLPKLDSISIKNKVIYNTIRETYTIQIPQKPMRRWNVGVQGGYGYGFLYKGFEPYVGVGLTYRIW